MPAKDTVATVISCLRYRDAPAAIGVAHARLRFGNGMVMLGSMRGDECGTYDPWQQPQA